MKWYRNTETDEIISEHKLKAEFERLKAEQPEEYDHSFFAFIHNCTDKNGFLEELKTAMVKAAMVLAVWYSSREDFPGEWENAVDAWNALYKHDPQMGDDVLKTFGLFEKI